MNGYRKDCGRPDLSDMIMHIQVSKGAAVHLTRQLAFDFSHQNIKIRVNGLAPGKQSLSMSGQTGKSFIQVVR